MEDPKTPIDTNFFKKYINGFVPSSLACILLYLSFQIMTQLASLQKEISELRSSILTRDVVHEIARQ